jgi:hypothetical protein
VIDELWGEYLVEDVCISRVLAFPKEFIETPDNGLALFRYKGFPPFHSFPWSMLAAAIAMTR